MNFAVGCSAAFGEDAEVVALFDGFDAFVEAAVDADGAVVFEDEVPEPVFELVVGGVEAEFFVFVVGGEHEEEWGVNIAGVVGGDNEWFVRQVFYAFDVFDE